MPPVDPETDRSSANELPGGISMDHFYQLIIMDPENLARWLEAYPPADREKFEKLVKERQKILSKKSRTKKADK